MSKRMDTLETLSQALLGIVIGFLVNLTIFPLLGIPMDSTKAASVTVLYIFVSYIRSYTIRRMFRRIGERPEKITVPVDDDPCTCRHCGVPFVSILNRIDHEHGCTKRGKTWAQR